MTDQQSTAGLKVTGSKLQLVELGLRSGALLVKDLHEVFFNEKIDFQKDKETKISALLQGAFDEILLQSPLSEMYISFSLPQNLFYSMQVPYDDSLLYGDLIEHFRWELSLLYPFMDPNELLIQYYPIRENIFIPGTSAYVSALPRNILNIFQNFCRDNSMHFRFADSAHTASDKALVTNKDISEEKLLMSAMVDEKTLSLIFYSYGEPFLFNCLAVNNVSEIPELITAELEKNNFNEPVMNAFICGDELSGAFVEKLSEKTNINFSFFNPFTRLQLDQNVLDNKYYLLKNNSFSHAVGVSIRSL